jgi:aminoglycoside phosphotransferase (APT) family kinase protein
VLGYVEGSADFAPAQPAAHARELADVLAAIQRVPLTLGDKALLPAPEYEATPAQDTDGLWMVDRIRAALPATPPQRRNAAVFLHGDFWPGNVLSHEGAIVSVIDWEDAAFGDPLSDISKSRLEIATIFGIDAMRSFTERYQERAGVDMEGLAYWDLQAALRYAGFASPDLPAWAAYFWPRGRPDISELSIRQAYSAFVEEALAATT